MPSFTNRTISGNLIRNVFNRQHVVNRLAQPTAGDKTKRQFMESVKISSSQNSVSKKANIEKDFLRFRQPGQIDNANWLEYTKDNENDAIWISKNLDKDSTPLSLHQQLKIIESFASNNKTIATKTRAEEPLQSLVTSAIDINKITDISSRTDTLLKQLAIGLSNKNIPQPASRQDVSDVSKEDIIAFNSTFNQNTNQVLSQNDNIKSSNIEAKIENNKNLFKSSVETSITRYYPSGQSPKASIESRLLPRKYSVHTPNLPKQISKTELSIIMEQALTRFEAKPWL